VEFHKPKPVHNWRELLSEIGVIVIGVCIALAAEQAVEWLHWQGEVKAARQALAGEISANGGYFARRIAIAPCMHKQFMEAQAILVALEAGKPVPAFTVFRPGGGSLLVDGEWQSQRASQTLTHFPREELATMSRYYAQLPELAYWVRSEMEIWAQLGVLKNPPAGMGPSDFARLHSMLGLAERYGALVDLNAHRMLVVGASMKIAPPPLDRTRVALFCTGSDAQNNDYLKTISR